MPIFSPPIPLTFSFSSVCFLCGISANSDGMMYYACGKCSGPITWADSFIYLSHWLCWNGTGALLWIVSLLSNIVDYRSNTKFTILAFKTWNILMKSLSTSTSWAMPLILIVQESELRLCFIASRGSLKLPIGRSLEVIWLACQRWNSDEPVDKMRDWQLRRQVHQLHLKPLVGMLLMCFLCLEPGQTLVMNWGRCWVEM